MVHSKMEFGNVGAGKDRIFLKQNLRVVSFHPDLPHTRHMAYESTFQRLSTNYKSMTKLSAKSA